jgi:hypothetical protein
MSWMRVVVFFAVVGLFVVGFYNYQELQRQVQTAEQREETVKNQLDSVTNQYEGIAIVSDVINLCSFKCHQFVPGYSCSLDREQKYLDRRSRTKMD